MRKRVDEPTNGECDLFTCETSRVIGQHSLYADMQGYVSRSVWHWRGIILSKHVVDPAIVCSIWKVHVFTKFMREDNSTYFACRFNVV